MHRRLFLALFALSLALLSACSTVRIPDDAFFIYPKDPPASSMPLPRVQLDVAPGLALEGAWVRTPAARASVLFLGPNAGTVRAMSAFLQDYSARHAVNVLMFDYRGYGHNAGTLDWNLLQADAHRALDWLKAQPEAAGKPVYVHGFSLGSFAAALLAQNASADGWILQGSGTHVRDWTHYRTPWFLRPFVRFEFGPRLQQVDLRDAIRPIQTPLLFLVARNDEAAPWQMTQSLYEAASSPEKTLAILPEGGHNHLFEQAGYHTALDRFIGQLHVTP